MKGLIWLDNPADLAASFRALGDPMRLRLFRFLSSCCCEVAVGEDGRVRPVEGKTVGEVCCSVTGEAKITSTLSHHLKELRLAGLITMERRGKHIVCAANPYAVRRLRSFLDGCQGESNSHE